MQETVSKVVDQIGTTVRSISNNAFQTVSGLLSNVFNFFLFLFLFFFTIFFIFRDGQSIKQVIMDVSPIAQQQEYILFKKVGAAVDGVVKGAFLTALIQGAAATVGFQIFGVPHPILWGLFTIMAALVPSIGTSLSIVPAVIYLLLTGHIAAAIGLAIWGAVAVGLIDNLVGPKIIGSRTQLHPLLVLISVLGGLQVFGFVGFLLGPIIMAIFVALVDMYRTDFKEYLEQ
jgi:predicted PurR-regulated permease PerM